MPHLHDPDLDGPAWALPNPREPDPVPPIDRAEGWIIRAAWIVLLTLLPIFVFLMILARGMNRPPSAPSVRDQGRMSRALPFPASERLVRSRIGR